MPGEPVVEYVGILVGGLVDCVSSRSVVVMGVVLSSSTKSKCIVGENGAQYSQTFKYIRFSVSGKFSGSLV